MANRVRVIPSSGGSVYAIPVSGGDVEGVLSAGGNVLAVPVGGGSVIAVPISSGNVSVIEGTPPPQTTPMALTYGYFSALAGLVILNGNATWNCYGQIRLQATRQADQQQTRSGWSKKSATGLEGLTLFILGLTVGQTYTVELKLNADAEGYTDVNWHTIYGPFVMPPSGYPVFWEIT